MTALVLDARNPLLVVVGSFNPAIFSPTWLATNVFGVPEGAEVSVLEALVQIDPAALMRLSFINGVAFNITSSRLELFAVNGDPATHLAVEAALDKVLELLPHTPLAGIGCNFRWLDAEPSAETMNLFDTPEGLEGDFDVVARQFTAQLSLDSAVLNFTRASQESEVLFRFNYHQNVANVIECRALIGNLVATRLAHSTSMMTDTYGYKDFSTQGFESGQSGEMIDAAETID